MADFQVWSWDVGNRMWLAVDQGTWEHVNASAARRWKAAEKYGMTGSAFYVARNAPTLPPQSLMCDVVAEPAKATSIAEVSAIADEMAAAASEGLLPDYTPAEALTNVREALAAGKLDAADYSLPIVLADYDRLLAGEASAASVDRDAQVVRAVMAGMTDGMLRLNPPVHLDEAVKDRWRNHALRAIAALPPDD